MTRELTRRRVLCGTATTSIALIAGCIGEDTTAGDELPTTDPEQTAAALNQTSHETTTEFTKTPWMLTQKGTSPARNDPDLGPSAATTDTSPPGVEGNPGVEGDLVDSESESDTPMLPDRPFKVRRPLITRDEYGNYMERRVLDHTGYDATAWADADAYYLRYGTDEGTAAGISDEIGKIAGEYTYCLRHGAPVYELRAETFHGPTGTKIGAWRIDEEWAVAVLTGDMTLAEYYQRIRGTLNSEF